MSSNTSDPVNYLIHNENKAALEGNAYFLWGLDYEMWFDPKLGGPNTLGMLTGEWVACNKAKYRIYGKKGKLI